MRLTWTFEIVIQKIEHDRLEFVTSARLMKRRLTAKVSFRAKPSSRISVGISVPKLLDQNA